MFFIICLSQYLKVNIERVQQEQEQHNICCEISSYTGSSLFIQKHSQFVAHTLIKWQPLKSCAGIHYIVGVLQKEK